MNQGQGQTVSGYKQQVARPIAGNKSMKKHLFLVSKKNGSNTGNVEIKGNKHILHYAV